MPVSVPSTTAAEGIVADGKNGARWPSKVSYKRILQNLRASEIPMTVLLSQPVWGAPTVAIVRPNGKGIRDR